MYDMKNNICNGWQQIVRGPNVTVNCDSDILEWVAWLSMSVHPRDIFVAVAVDRVNRQILAKPGVL